MKALSLLMHPLSIYRGYCAQDGIGESPEDVPGTMRGEQYIASDPELWRDHGLANAVRKWMTLYDDYGIAEKAAKEDEDIEGWSYFNYRNLRFVIRLISNGKFGPRLAYFAHGQAWDERDFQNNHDPGALLGRSEAFHGRWNDGQPLLPLGPVQPEMVWGTIVRKKENLWVAIRLLAQLYRACVTGCPVILAAPIREFTGSSRLHQLVSFARAALPLPIKRDCRIRIFTGRPETFLGELRTHLVAVPEELVAAALMARPDAALLDMDCKRRSGPEADQGYEGYARHVVDRAISLEEYPDSLFAFTSRVKLPTDRMPSDGEAASVPMTYHLVADPDNQPLMDNLLDHFRKESAKPGLAWDWKQIIYPEDWGRFSRNKLTNIALSIAESPAGGVLIQGAREELTRRGITLDREAGAWLASLPKEIRWEEILALAKAALLPLALPNAEDLSPLQLSELLDSKELAGEILSRIEISDKVAIAASKRAEDIRRLILLATSRAECRHNADKVIRMLAASGNLPAGLTESDLLMFKPPEANAELENYLNWAEVLGRANSDQGQRQIDALKSQLVGSAARVRLFDVLGTARWKVLKDFVFPESWDDDLRDRLLRSDRLLRRMETGRILKLLSEKQEMPARVVRLLDDRMKSGPKETTDSLVRAGRWLSWRVAERDVWLSEMSAQECAVVWLSTPNSTPSLEEWNHVMQDLGQISVENLEEIRSQSKARKPPWPPVPLFEEQQLADLVGRCPADLGIGAELAEMIGSGNDAYSRVLRHFQAKHNILVSDEAFRCLGRGESAPALLGIQEASELVRFAGDRRPQALAVLGSAVLRNLSNNVDEAERAANNARLWDSAPFIRVLASWLARARLSMDRPADLKALAMLERHVQDSWVGIERPSPELEQQAESYAKKGLARLADFLCPDLYRKLVYALVRGDASDSGWKKLVEEVQGFKNRDIKRHPLLLMAEKTRRLPLEEQCLMDENGWSTFKKVCSSLPGTIRFLAAWEGVLPIIHLAVALRDDVGLGKIAAGILYLKSAGAYFGDEAWWEAFFSSIEKCGRRSAGQEVRDRPETVWSVVFQAISHHDFMPNPWPGNRALEKRIWESITAGEGAEEKAIQ